ncbi:MAG: V-type ATPase subunit [Candidatus Thorarchaeota archaeon]|nr:V-type ATPase subunit [Candidatus Thorarchaeota archaeon]
MVGYADMSFRSANEYAFINARIRGLKSRLLTVGDYERMLQAGGYSEFLKLLMGTSYGPIISREHIPGEIYPDELSLILSKYFAEVSHAIASSLSGKIREFSETYMNMFLAESIKSILRGLHVNLDKDEILRFAVPTTPEEAALFERLVDMGTVDRMIDELPFADMKLALLTRLPAYDKYNSTAPLEVALEEWYLHTMHHVLSEFSLSEHRKVILALETRVAMRNLLTAVRALHFGLSEDILEVSLIRFTPAVNRLNDSIKTKTNWKDVFALFDGTKYATLVGHLSRIYTEGEDLSEVELAVEDYLAQDIRKQMVGYPFHLGVIFGFLTLKYYEVRNIRSIAVGIERGEPAETIRRMINIF